MNPMSYNNETRYVHGYNSGINSTGISTGFCLDLRSTTQEKHMLDTVNLGNNHGWEAHRLQDKWPLVLFSMDSVSNYPLIFFPIVSDCESLSIDPHQCSLRPWESLYRLHISAVSDHIIGVSFCAVDDRWCRNSQLVKFQRISCQWCAQLQTGQLYHTHPP